LLKELIVGTPLQQRLVVAYLIGGPLTEDRIATNLGLRICATATDLGGVVGWNARSASYRPGLDLVEPESPAAITSPQRRVCVNPLTWRHDDAVANRELNRGLVRDL